MPEISDREHRRRAIYAARFRRLLPAFAARLQIDPEALYALAERTFFQCNVCLGPLPVPALYKPDVRAIGVVCGHCAAAIEKTGGDLAQLSRHWRFSMEHARNRGRLARLVALHDDR